MSKESTNVAKFNGSTALPVAAEELFLPSIEAVVKHIARVVAERDYKQFLASGEINYIEDASEGGA